MLTATTLGFGFGIGHVDFGFGICGDLLLKPLSCVFLVVVGVLVHVQDPLEHPPVSLLWYSASHLEAREHACNITHSTKQRGPVQVPALVILFSYSDYHPGGPSATRPSGLPLLPEQSSSEQGLQRPVKSRQSPKYRIRSLIRLRARISSSIRGIVRSRSGALTIYGYTNTTTFTSNSNSTTVFHSLASNAGSDDASGTLWIHDDFGMYIVNVNNTFGLGVQVIALSQDGRQVDFMGVYLKGIIEGGIDSVVKI
ncbi:carbohydrate esterase family 8 protein [Lentinula edodes]|uniref:Carbohydrate esterase family 8 protein n=1 Tax=Lentinula edodes TaxID=5353 RepID=A0A1Q3EPE9_LENED|nr:carbohydrate esterase family 8 protein [Lentinula edodes]